PSAERSNPCLPATSFARAHSLVGRQHFQGIAHLALLGATWLESLPPSQLLRSRSLVGRSAALPGHRAPRIARCDLARIPASQPTPSLALTRWPFGSTSRASRTSHCSVRLGSNPSLSPPNLSFRGFPYHFRCSSGFAARTTRWDC